MNTKKFIERKVGFILFVLVLIFSFSVHVKAYEVTTVLDGAADYYVDSILDEKELDFGIKYHNDWAYSRINDSTYSVSGAYDAGGSANSDKILEYGKYYSQNVNVLEIGKDSGVNIVSYANIKLGAWTLTNVKGFIEKYEKTHEGEKVIAAINGDFFDINSDNNYPKTSRGGTVSNGNYYKVNSSWLHIGFKSDENGLSMIGNIKPSVSSKPKLEVLDSDGNVTYSVDVDKINEVNTGDEVSVYFTFYNSNHQAVKENVSNAILVSGDEIAPYSKNSVFGLGSVKNLDYSGDIYAYQFAVLTNNKEVKSKINTESTIRVQYYYEGALSGYDNCIGYPNSLLVDGEVIIDPNYRHPRTMIGKREDGTIIMTTVDGRRTNKGYYGVSPIEQSALMKHYGCTDAYNLDGGGSTTMVILENGNYVIKNEPSDNSPRNDGNCLLVTVKVPKLSLTFEDIKTTSLKAKLDIIEGIDKYEEYYLELEGEKIKFIDGYASFSTLEKNKEYIYKIYTKENGKLVGLPITGSIKTAKEKFSFSNSTILKKNVKGEDVFEISISLLDNDNSYVNMVLMINNRRYYVRNGVFTIPVEEFSNIGSYLQITYDLNDKNGRITEKVVDYNASFSNIDTALNSISNDIGAWLDALLSK